MSFIDEVISTLENYSSDLSLAANYGEFAESPEMVIEHLQHIDTVLSQLRDMVSNNVQSVIELKYSHRNTWRDKPDSFWLIRLLMEVFELIGAMIGIHQHEKTMELNQIASICMNWLDKINRSKGR